MMLMMLFGMFIKNIVSSDVFFGDDSCDGDHVTLIWKS